MKSVECIISYRYLTRDWCFACLTVNCKNLLWKLWITIGQGTKQTPSAGVSISVHSIYTCFRTLCIILTVWQCSLINFGSAQLTCEFAMRFIQFSELTVIAYNFLPLKGLKTRFKDYDNHQSLHLLIYVCHQLIHILYCTNWKW